MSRSISITPDEGDFTVVVSASLDTTQAQVIQVLQNAGIQNLSVTGTAMGQNSSVYPQPAASQIYYSLTFTVAPQALRDYAKKLDALRAGLPSTLTSLQYSGVLAASQAAVDAAHQATLPQLLSDARARAQLLATAAGLRVGAIQSISESTYGASVANYWFNVPSFLGSVTSNSGTQHTFYATVSFAVLGQ